MLGQVPQLDWTDRQSNQEQEEEVPSALSCGPLSCQDLLCVASKEESAVKGVWAMRVQNQAEAQLIN